MGCRGLRHALADPVLPGADGHAAQDRAVEKPDPWLPNYHFDVAVVELLRLGGPVRHGRLWRSFAYAGIATVLCILIGYPLAYYLAFRAGKWRSCLLGLVMIPFFTSFLIRTISWRTILGEPGPGDLVRGHAPPDGGPPTLHITSTARSSTRPKR